MKHDESALQVAVIAYLRAVLPRSAHAFAVPNGLHTLKLQASRAVICIVRNDGFCAFIELKTGKNKVTPEQHEFLDWCSSHNVCAAVCLSIDDVRSALVAWGFETREAE
jgi:VRR-NUC domain